MKHTQNFNACIKSSLTYLKNWKALFIHLFHHQNFLPTWYHPLVMHKEMRYNRL